MLSIPGLIIIVLCVTAGYYAAKKFFRFKNNRVIMPARIRAIHLTQVGNIWAPEIVVEYEFYYNKIIFRGKDNLRIDKLIPDTYLFLQDRNGFPVLQLSTFDLTGEEHIEAYILENSSQVAIEFNPRHLPESKIYHVGNENKSLFQNVDVQFPWTD